MVDARMPVYGKRPMVRVGKRMSLPDFLTQFEMQPCVGIVETQAAEAERQTYHDAAENHRKSQGLPQDKALPFLDGNRSVHLNGHRSFGMEALEC